MANLKNTSIDDTGTLKLPVGTTAERPASPEIGFARFNTSKNIVEYYNGQGWVRTDKIVESTVSGDVYSYNIFDKTDNFRVHVFTGNGTLTVDTPGEIEYLIVAGGGAGGADDAGGGGGGGFLSGITTVVPGATYQISVGAGGDSVHDIGNQGRGDSGQNSSAFGFTATGGGGGGGGVGGQRDGASGGSGGGGAGETTSTGGSGIEGQGFKGGDHTNSDGQGSGGGGAGAAGIDGTTATNGGKGLPSAITGYTVFYAGGGGGSGPNTTPGTFSRGGSGGGTAGEESTQNIIAGIANTGGGGGGGAYPGSAPYYGKDGGSGVVIVRHKTDANQIYRPEIATEGLVCSLDAGIVSSLDIGEHSEPGGRPWRDLTQENNNAQVLNADGKTYVTGKHNGSVIFDGNSTIVEIPNSSSLNFTEQLTYELWCKFDAFTGNNTGNNSTPIAKATQNYRIFIPSDGTPRSRFSGFNDLSMSFSLNTGQWYCLHLLRDTTGFAWYVNGAADTIDSQTGTMNTTSADYTIGGWSTSDLARQVDGEIAVVRIYNRRLGEKEVQNNFEALRGRFGI